MNTSQQLRQSILAMDHKSYPAYKSLAGRYKFDRYTLCIDHVQGDPFAAPSKVHVELDGRTAGFPAHLYDTKEKRIALQDQLTRIFGRELSAVSKKAGGSGKSGLISVSRCGQQILERSCCELNPADGALLFRLEVGFPANGRSINARELIKILFDFLPDCVEKSLICRNLRMQELKAAAQLCEDQMYIREQLKELKLCAFVANGAILPRVSGISQRPLKEAVPFQSPASMEVTLELPHHGPLTGMGIRRGITLIVGGGFHGKSTLLNALELGVYNHIAGDGREYVITDDSAFKLRAEDSRYISNSNISLFIQNLPGRKDTTSFSTEDASGSTSQAANTIEAIESGSRLLLIDEDTSATNFMIRDQLMQSVISDREEPITPFISRVSALYDQSGISSVIVAGSSGAYFHVADTVLQMKEYIPLDITAKAKDAAAGYPALHVDGLSYRVPDFSRSPKAFGELQRLDRVKMKSMGLDGIQINHSTTDLRYLEQLADNEQLTALAYMVVYAARHLMDGRRTLTQLVDQLELLLEKKGLAGLAEGSYLPSNLCRPRRQEIFACFNRCRELRF